MFSLIKSAAAKSATAVLICLFFGSLLVSFQDSTSRHQTHYPLNKRSVGNNVSAVDIYGLGVRIGFYLQSVGISITTFRQFRNLVRSKVYHDEVDERDEPHSDTPVLAFAIVILAVLISLTTQISARNISPAEVLVVLNILSTNTMVNLGLLYLGVGDFRGNGIGYLLNLCCSIWAQVLLIWIWVRGRHVLPLLETSNHTWFFAKVRIDGWFWIFSTVSLSVSMLFLLPVLFIGLAFVGHTTKWWWQHRAESEIWEKKHSSWQRFISFTVGSIGVFLLPILIATVEMTIRYNGLQPESDLSSPSQLIPFAAGIANSIDSLLYLVRPYKKRTPEPAPASGLLHKPSSSSSSSPAGPNPEHQDPANGSFHMSGIQRRDAVEPLEGAPNIAANV